MDIIARAQNIQIIVMSQGDFYLSRSGDSKQRFQVRIKMLRQIFYCLTLDGNGMKKGNFKIRIISVYTLYVMYTIMIRF